MNEFFNNIDWLSMFDTFDVNNCYEIFLKNYQQACDKFIPTKQVMPVDFNYKWLNGDIISKSKRKNKLWFRLRASGYKDKKLLCEYTNSKRELQKAIKNSIWNFERDLVIKAKSNPKMLYSYIKNKQHVKTGITSIKNKHGAIVTRPMEVVDSLNSHFKSVFGKEEDEFMPYFENRTTKCCPILVITEHEVYKRLVALDIYKSIGVDGVNPHVLLNCAQSLILSSEYFR